MSLDDLAALLDGLGDTSRVTRSIIVRPQALGPGYRGRRARRHAFYHRQRCARVLRRVAREFGPAFDEAMSGAWRDLLVYGLGAIAVARPVGPTFYDADGAEVPPPDGSPRDASIASMLNVRRMTRAEVQELMSPEDRP